MFILRISIAVFFLIPFTQIYAVETDRVSQIRLSGAPFRVNVDLGIELDRHLRRTGLAKLVSKGRYCTHRECKGRLSILVLAPRENSDASVGRLNAAYDRLYDVVFLDENAVSYLSDSNRSPEALSRRQYTEFLLFHELGHRKLGSSNRTFFYFAGRAFSSYQLEEFEADKWALSELVRGRGEDGTKIALNILDGTLFRYFGSEFPIESVADEHPSMIYRILMLLGNIDRASVDAHVGDLFKDIVLTVDSELAGVGRLPKGTAVDSMVICGGNVHVLTKSGEMARVPLIELVWAPLASILDTDTVRRYFEDVVPLGEKKFSAATTTERRSLVCLADGLPLLVMSRNENLQIRDTSDGRVIWETKLENASWFVKKSASINASVLIPGRDTSGFFVTSYSRNDGVLVSRFGPQTGLREHEVVGVRQDALLTTTNRTDMFEIFALKPLGSMNLVISTVPGSAPGLCGELAGLIVQKPQGSAIIDNCPTCGVDLAAPKCRLANLERISRATWILGAEKLPLSEYSISNFRSRNQPLTNVTVSKSASCQMVSAPTNERSIFVFDAQQLGLTIPPESMWRKICNMTCEAAAVDGLIQGTILRLGNTAEYDYFDLLVERADVLSEGSEVRLRLARAMDTPWSVPSATLGVGRTVTVLVNNDHGSTYAHSVFSGIGSYQNMLDLRSEAKSRCEYR